MGYLFGICVEKNSELSKDDPNRKYKGRVVYGGHAVTDQKGRAALFRNIILPPRPLFRRELLTSTAFTRATMNNRLTLVGPIVKRLSRVLQPSFASRSIAFQKVGVNATRDSETRSFPFGWPSTVTRKVATTGSSIARNICWRMVGPLFRNIHPVTGMMSTS